MVEGQGLVVRTVAGGLAVLLLLVASGTAELVLSLSTIGLFLSQVRRGRRSLPSLGWTLLLLAVGLGLGVLILSLVGAASVGLPLAVDQLQALPAVLLMLAGALLLA